MNLIRPILFGASAMAFILAPASAAFADEPSSSPVVIEVSAAPAAGAITTFSLLNSNGGQLDGVTFDYDYDGDGFFEVTGAPGQTRFTYPDDGSFVFQARMTDAAGNVSNGSRVVDVAPSSSPTSAETVDVVSIRNSGTAPGESITIGAHVSNAVLVSADGTSTGIGSEVSGDKTRISIPASAELGSYTVRVDGADGQTISFNIEVLDVAGLILNVFSGLFGMLWPVLVAVGFLGFILIISISL